MQADIQLKLFNTLKSEKQIFTPLDANNVRMYVCGPTVYDRPHIGNARAVVVYDVLFRLLQKIYGAKNITFARNITDVDDKINDAAKKNGETIKALTTRITEFFHADMDALNNLRPTVEPRATEYISQIISLIEKIIANGHAYVSEGHVLFAIDSFEKLGDYKYGDLSGKKLEDLIAGARVEVESYKRNAGDFVLWKPADAEDDASSKFDSPWGVGRPGWHIECSAMSTNILGNDFDIHGGGADLKFPHHENEIAQSCSAHKGSHYAKYWVHNGFLTVNGEKMSKSLGNFTTVRELIDKGVHGEVIRLVLLSTHYRKPLDFNEKAIEDAKKTLDKLYSAKARAEQFISANISEYMVIKNTHDNNDTKNVEPELESKNEEYYIEFHKYIYDDLNVAAALSNLLFYCLNIPPKKDYAERWLEKFEQMTNLLGLVQTTAPEKWFAENESKKANIDEAFVQAKINERIEAKKNKDFALADKIRNELLGQGIVLKDTPQGTEWEVK